MLFLITLLFIPLTATAVDCNIDDLNECKTTGGCYVENGDSCAKCTEDPVTHQGYYCPGNGTGNKYPCPEPFTRSINGATGPHECHANVSCGGTTVEVFCDGISDTGCPLPAQDSTPREYEVQWTYSPTLNGNEWLKKQAFFWVDSGRVYPNDDIPPGYHLETIPRYTANASVNGGDWTWVESSYDFKCVLNEKPCADFNADNTFPSVNCSAYTTDHACSAQQGCGWMQYAGDGVYGCFYLDDVGISPKAETNCATGTVSGTATWIDKNDTSNTLGYGHWDVSQCKCNNTGIQLDDERCYGSSDQDYDDSEAPVTVVHTTAEHIIFKTTVQNPKCSRCFEDGHVPGEKYFVHGDDYDENLKIVSKCTIATTNSNNFFKAFGYYRRPAASGYCNSTTDWATPLSANPCPRVACTGAGKSTKTHLPIGTESSVCKYISGANGTKFCDAQGCFYFSDDTELTEWGLD